MITGTVFNIQRFCVNDGPGIRTTVFLKGCPLRCVWCHNPESHQAAPQVFYDASLCIGCGLCKKACPRGTVNGKSACLACGMCAEACPTGARERTGEEMTVSQVMDAVLRDADFYQTSGGGLTLSGGEPLYQPDFSLALLKDAKKAGLHTCVETCGYGAKETLLKMAEVTDLFLYDWKLTDREQHRKYTGVSNERIKENLVMLNDMGKDIILRCPVIPGINDTPEHFRGIADLSESLAHIGHIELEPYHGLGADKCVRLGQTPISYQQPSMESIDSWQKKLHTLTSKEIKIG